MSQTNDLLPVRSSHLLRHASVGAIVRGAGTRGLLMVIQDIRYWTDKDKQPGGEVIPYVERVKTVLNIGKDIRTPPLAKIVKKGEFETVEGTCIPATRFPSWCYCDNRRCKEEGLLYWKPWKGREEDHGLTCPGCRRPRTQWPWVMIHAEGMLADVPCHSIAHREAKHPQQIQCGADRASAYLKVSNDSGKISIQCARCKATGHMQADAREPYGANTWQQPWIQEAVSSQGPAILTDINDIRIHEPRTASALQIPPESRLNRGTVVDHLYRNSRLRKQLSTGGDAFMLKRAMNTVAGELNCRREEVEAAVKELDTGYPDYGKKPVVTDLLWDEYNALREAIPDQRPDEDLVTRHHTDAWAAMAAGLDGASAAAQALIEQVVAVDRLKEILVFNGFSRAGGDPMPPDLDGSADWIPGLELYGEGIFLTFNPTLLERWESDPAVWKRADTMASAFATSQMQTDPQIVPSARFILLHTLSHLLIRQLETQSGYPAASLKERLYASSNQERPMAGLLIYVAVPDIAGSLGGLAELARPDRLRRLLAGALDGAQWCSLDPVCGEQEGHGMNRLNRAACHACALVPEPSCQCANVLLDRCMIKGIPAQENQQGMPGILEMAAIESSYAGKKHHG